MINKRIFGAPIDGKVKKQLAERNNEITLLWNVGIKEKNKLYEQNIFSWSDPRCNSKNMGLNQLSTKGIIIDKIISINKNNDNIIEPEIITNNLNEWNENRTLEFFIDFETSDSYLENNLDNTDKMISIIAEFVKTLKAGTIK